ncbi:MAG: AAA domain-containing protein [Podila humilis]|nr:MAG: AAA domain-containing protein [Podila humilis]
MSSIEKILIRGIRSFEADAGDAATISFYSPLTLITGHNGSGKTTIIECLKYATTGELPPGSKGGAFVNDPKMSDSPMIKAQVRLRFKNVNNQTLSVVRSLSLTAKKTGYTQKTLENVLSMVDPNTGELASVSSKCAEIDVDIPAHLGVSRAILDNVIFCHQEESNWPLSEPSILKKKFDEIFASTKYTSVLESIKSIKKEKTIELKVLFNSLDYLRQNKDRAEKLRQTLTANTERLEKIQEKIDQLELDIDRCVEEISRLMAKTREIQAIETTLNALTMELKSTQENVRHLEGTFSLYSESDAELQEMLFKHDLSVKTADQERAKLERSKQRAASSIANIQASVTQNQQTIGQLRALLDSNKTKQSERDHFVQELGQQYSIDGFDDQPLLAMDVQRFLRKIEALIQQATSDGDRLRNDVRAKEQEIRTELSDKKARMDMAASLKAKTKEGISSAQSKLRQQHSELSKHASTEADLETTEKLLAEQESSLQAFKTSDPGLDSMEMQRRSKMAEVEMMENELARLSEQSATQVKNAGMQARLGLLKNKFSQSSDQVQELMAQNREAFRTILNEDSSPEEVEHKLNPLLKEKETAVRTSSQLAEKLKREISGHDVRIDNVKSQLKKHEKTVQDCDKKISTECKGEPFLELLQRTEEDLAETREGVQDVKAMSSMYARFITMAEKKHTCPLCTRSFDDQLETQFVGRLKRLMEKGADGDDDRQLAELEATVNRLRALKSSWDTAEHLKTIEIPALELQLSELEQKKSTSTDTLDVAEMDAAHLNSELGDLKRLIAIAKSISSICQETLKDGSDIKSLETELMCAGSLQSAEDLQAEYTTVKQQMNTARQEHHRLSQEISQMNTEIQRREQVLRKLKQKITELNHQQSRKAQIQDQIAEIESLIVSLKKELEQQESEQSQSVVPEINKLNDRLREVMSEGQAVDVKAQQAVSDLQTNLGKVQMYNRDIERVDTRATMSELSRIEASTDSQVEEIQQYTNELQSIEQETQALQERLAGFKTLQRNIDDNLRYRRHTARVRDLEAQIAETSSKRDVDAQGTYSRQLSRLHQQQTSLTSERAGLQGELRQLQDQRRQNEEELQGDYKDVVEKYHENLINCKTTELVLEDLEKYSKALQSAIVDYHTMKMEEVNMSIKELWTNTYQGTDIDTIEIRSDQEGMRANQTYNYRVVMVQRGRALDMRGRCSAGQKVLASIIIRLALAESFSVNCGILALDEPTTNLDHANIAQLAQSLKTIIEKNRRQSNFQLIIITHDEEFLNMISLSDYADFYYRVYKNSDQYSCIEKLTITDKN